MGRQNQHCLRKGLEGGENPVRRSGAELSDWGGGSSRQWLDWAGRGDDVCCVRR